jgi:hypothetical protein
MAELNATEIILIGAAAYLGYSWYSGTGLFAPAAAAATTPAVTPVTTTPVTSPVVPTPPAVSTVAPTPPVTPNNGYTGALTAQSPWTMRPGGSIRQMVSRTVHSAWSASATYGAGDTVMYALPGGPTQAYVNLTGANAGNPATDTTDWLPVQWSAESAEVAP